MKSRAGQATSLISSSQTNPSRLRHLLCDVATFFEIAVASIDFQVFVRRSWIPSLFEFRSDSPKAASRRQLGYLSDELPVAHRNAFKVGDLAPLLYFKWPLSVPNFRAPTFEQFPALGRNISDVRGGWYELVGTLTMPEGLRTLRHFPFFPNLHKTTLFSARSVSS